MLRKVNISCVRTKYRGVLFMRTKRANRLKKIGNQNSPVKQSINRLADFLNCKYETGSREKVLQQRVLRDLGPLIPPKEKDMTTDKIEFFLAHLQAKINRMNLRPHWVITAAEIALKGLRPGEG